MPGSIKDPERLGNQILERNYNSALLELCVGFADRSRERSQRRPWWRSGRFHVRLPKPLTRSPLLIDDRDGHHP